jgi:hypothetical protein
MFLTVARDKGSGQILTHREVVGIALECRDARAIGERSTRPLHGGPLMPTPPIASRAELMRPPSVATAAAAETSANS